MGDTEAAKSRLEAISNMPVLELTEQVFELTKFLVEKGPIPEEYFEDALHIAVAAVNGIHYAIYSTLLIITKQSLFHLAGSLLHPILIPHQNSYIKCVQNFRDIQLSPNQHFKIKVSPLARRS